MTESTALPKGADFLRRIAIARGVFILAEELRALQRRLESMNFKVFALSPGLSEEQLAPLIAQRILVTNRASDFQEFAAIYECSIIEIGNIDPGRTVTLEGDLRDLDSSGPEAQTAMPSAVVP